VQVVFNASIQVRAIACNHVILCVYTCVFITPRKTLRHDMHDMHDMHCILHTVPQIVFTKKPLVPKDHQCDTEGAEGEQRAARRPGRRDSEMDACSREPHDERVASGEQAAPSFRLFAVSDLHTDMLANMCAPSLRQLARTLAHPRGFGRPRRSTRLLGEGCDSRTSPPQRPNDPPPIDPRQLFKHP
jgi:hypothetical protein